MVAQSSKIEAEESSKIEGPLKNVEIADPTKIFRGLTYGEWAEIRWNYVLSARPDNYYDPGRGMIF